MQNSFKKSFMFFMILLALTFSALGVTPALADDGVTPPTDAPVVEQPVADTPVVDAPVVDAPAVEEPTVVDAPAVEQPVAEEPAAEAATVSEILETAPEGTEVVVLDESGEALPLASAEAAEVLASGDPYFWDGTQYVGYTTTTCPAIVTNCNVVASAPIQAAVDAFAASSSATGEIFVAAGTYTENVSINKKSGANLANLSGLIGAGSGLTTINGALQVYLPNAFTLSGFTFNNSVHMQTGGDVAMYDVVVDGTYMDIYSGGNVELNGVAVSQSPYEVGAYVNADGDISIWDSAFNDNDYYGLDAYSYSGNVMLDGVTASGNGDYGAVVGTDGDISIFDSAFNDNYGTGLYVYSNSNVILDGVTASGSTYGDGADVYANGEISIFDSVFNENAYTGLYAESYLGNVVLDGVTANGNGDYGVDLRSGTETSADTTVEVFCSNFSDNAYGLYANSPDLYLNGVTFSGNADGDYRNKKSSGNIWVNEYECGKTPVNGSTENHEGSEKKEQSFAPLYVVVEQVQGQLPAVLGEGFKFGSALKVELTNEGRDVTDLAITLSFPIPADMKDANLAVMFWNGSAWVEVSGGSVVGGFYVITVDQPGMYVLAAK